MCALERLSELRLFHLCVKGGDLDVNFNGQSLIDFCDDSELIMLNGSDKCRGIHTRTQNDQVSVVDYALVSENVYEATYELYIDDYGLFHLGSDHNILLMTVKKSPLTETNYQNTSEKIYWNIPQDWGEFKEKIGEVFDDWDPKKLNANDAWDQWKSKMLNVTTEILGQKKKKGNYKVWFDKEVEMSIKHRQSACRAHRQYLKRKNNPQFNAQYCNVLWEDYQSKRRNCKSLIKRKMMKKRVDRCSHIMEKGGPQLKDFWVELKGKKQSQKVSSVIIPGTNITTSDPNNIKESLKMHFSNIGNINERINSNVNNMYISDDPQEYIDHVNISYEDVMYAISDSKNNKSPGADLITNEIVKNGGNGMVSSLYKLFSRLIEIEYIPDKWNEGCIIPIYKKGDRRDLNNYRGITLNSCVAKMFSKIIAKKISEFLEEHNILTEVQGGFRYNRRCEDHIFVLKSILATRQAEGKKTHLAFLDFKKAFDSVWRQGLLRATKNVGINGKLLNLIQNMYSNVKCKVVFNDIESDMFDVNEGVKQGCPLSPVLFSIYMNELKKIIKERKLGISIFNTQIGSLFWADDVVLIGESAHDLEQLLDATSNFSKQWKLNFNLEKSNVLIVGQRVNKFRKWKLGEDFINETDKYKYLGTIISRKNNDNEHINEVIKKGNKIIAYIRSIIDNQDDFNRVYYGNLLWTTIGLPTINYGCSVWVPSSKTSIKKLENLQYQMAKIILRAPRNVANEALLGDLGWQSIETIQNRFRISYFDRLKKMDDDRWPRLLCTALMEVRPLTRWKWIDNVKTILEKYDLNENFNMEPQHHWLRSFKDEISLDNDTDWFEKAKKKTTLNDYIKFKNAPCLEYYLLDKVNFKGANLKFKARTNTLDLEGKKRSWSETYSGHCNICNIKEIESIDHFLFECEGLSSIRNICFNDLKNDLYTIDNYFWDIFINGSSEFKHHLLLDNIYDVYQNKQICNIFDSHCKEYLVKAMAHRTEVMKNIATPLI